MKKTRSIHYLSDVEISEVSLVDRGANDREYLLLKAAKRDPEPGFLPDGRKILRTYYRTVEKDTPSTGTPAEAVDVRISKIADDEGVSFGSALEKMLAESDYETDVLISKYLAGSTEQVSMPQEISKKSPPAKPNLWKCAKELASKEGLTKQQAVAQLLRIDPNGFDLEEQ